MIKMIKCSVDIDSVFDQLIIYCPTFLSDLSTFKEQRFCIWTNLYSFFYIFYILRLRHFWAFCTLFFYVFSYSLLWLQINTVKLRYAIIFSQNNSPILILFSSVFISYLSVDSCESSAAVQQTKNFLLIVFSVKVAASLLQVSLSCTVGLQPESAPSGEWCHLTASAASSLDAAVGWFRLSVS